MKKATFLRNNEMFYIEHNGMPGVGTLETRDEDVLTIRVGGKGYTVDDSYEYSESNGSVTYNKPAWKSSFTIRFLELSDADKLFPGSIKTFNDIESLTLSAQEALLSDGYQADKPATDIVSFTVDNNNNVLELIKTTDDGDIFYRSSNDWVMVGQDEEIPTIFDQIVIDVDDVEIENAIKLWDESELTGKDISYEEIRPLASINQ
jgi:hypothetical protein